MRFSIKSRRAAPIVSALVALVAGVAPAFGQDAETVFSDLRGPVETLDAAAALTEAGNDAIAATVASGGNPRVTPEPMIDGSSPPGFIAGNALRRTIDDDPFAPLGIRTGSFLLFPSVDFSTGYTTNTTDTKGGSGGAFAIVAPQLLLQSDWSRHEATVSMRGSYETYSNGTEDVPDADVEANLRLDFADRWNADFRTAYHYGRESLSDPDLPAGLTKGPDTYDYAGSAALSGAFGRSLFTIEASANRSLYGDGKSGGMRVDQSDRDNTVHAGRLRLGYEVTRTFVPFIEGVLSNRLYDQRKDDSGIVRSSHGDGLRAGIAFDRSPVSSGEIAIGYLRETFDDASLETLSAFTVDGSLVWSPSRLTTVTTDLFTSINPTTDAGSSGSVIYDGGVNLAYAWRANVILDGAAGVTYEGFQGTHQVDWTYRFGFGATWRINREAQLALGYEHVWRDSTDRANDYAVDTVRLDLKVQR